MTHLKAEENTLPLSLDYVRPLRAGRLELGGRLQWRSLPISYTVDRGVQSVIYDGLGSNRLVRAKEDPQGNIWFLSDNDVTGMDGIHIYNPTLDEWLQVTTTTHPRIGSGNVVDVSFAREIAYIALKQSLKQSQLARQAVLH